MSQIGYATIFLHRTVFLYLCSQHVADHIQRETPQFVFPYHITALDLTLCRVKSMYRMQGSLPTLWSVTSHYLSNIVPHIWECCNLLIELILPVHNLSRTGNTNAKKQFYHSRNKHAWKDHFSDQITTLPAYGILCMSSIVMSQTIEW